MGNWGVLLNGVYLSGASGEDAVLVDLESAGCTVPNISGSLSIAPDGLGLPEESTEDTGFFQQDGVRHYNDYYLPRIVTLDGVSVCSDDCPECKNEDFNSARQHVQDIIQAWKRACNDVELVLFTPCHEADNEIDEELNKGFGEGPFGETYFGGIDSMNSPERALNGPFGIIGRPRVAALKWLSNGCAVMTLRFDAVDQRIYVLDQCGTPGASDCVQVFPGRESYCRSFPICFTNEDEEPIGMCFNQLEPGSAVVEPTDMNVGGTECAAVTITLNGPLTNPRLVNIVTGDEITYNAFIPAGTPVVIDTQDLTAVSGGTDVTYRLGGTPSFDLAPGDHQFRIFTNDSDETDGYAEICSRPVVLSA